MPAEDPQDGARATCEQTGREQGRRGAVLHFWSTAGDLVHGTETEATTRQVAVDALDPERQDGIGTAPDRSALEG